MFILWNSKEVVIQKESIRYLERKDTAYNLLDEQPVLLFQPSSCFNCLPELVAHDINEDTLFLYQTEPLSSLGRKALIERFAHYGVPKSRVILWYLEEKDYFKRYEKGILENYEDGFRLVLKEK